MSALRLRSTYFLCPSPGCLERLEPDPDTPVLRCSMHGPMKHKPSIREIVAWVIEEHGDVLRRLGRE